MVFPPPVQIWRRAGPKQWLPASLSTPNSLYLAKAAIFTVHRKPHACIIPPFSECGWWSLLCCVVGTECSCLRLYVSVLKFPHVFSKPATVDALLSYPQSSPFVAQSFWHLRGLPGPSTIFPLLSPPPPSQPSCCSSQKTILPRVPPPRAF